MMLSTIFSRRRAETAIPRLSVLLILSAAAALGEPLKLVENGQPRSVIVLPEKPSPLEQYAVDELGEHIRIISGATLPVYRESDDLPKDKTRIYIGHTEAAKRAGIDNKSFPSLGYTAKRVNDNLFFLGVDGDGKLPPQTPLKFPATELDYEVESHVQVRIPTGSLMAVYEFLETQLGVRWLWPGETGINAPSRNSIEVDQLDLTGKPRFMFTNLGFGPVTHGKSGWYDPKAWEKFFHEQDVWLLRQRFGFSVRFKFNHAFTRYWERYGKSHSEYFAQLPNGERRPFDGDPKGRLITMCVSNPRLHENIVRDKWLNRKEELKVLNVCENDSPGMCTCNMCRAWDAPDESFARSMYWGEGIMPTKKTRFSVLRSIDGGGGIGPSLSDRYARFYLAIQQEARKHAEPPLVLGYAYANYSMPPKQTKLNDDIIICFVGWPYFPWTPEKVADAKLRWEGWANTGAKMMVRPNSILSGHNLPIFYARPMADTFSHAARHGLVASHFSSFLGQWGTQGPTLYTLARMHVRPEQPVEEILDEYYAAFGPAKGAVQRYFSFWEKISDAVSGEQFKQFSLEEGCTGYEDWLLVADRIFPDNVMEEGKQLMLEAEDTAKGDEMAAQRVGLLSKGLEHARLTLLAAKAFKRNQKAPSAEHTTAFQQALAELKAFRREIEMLPISNLSALEYRERPIWRRPPQANR